MRLCRPRSYMIRNALFTVNCARYASSSASITNYTALEHGREIFVFNHLQTNQVVYSLTRALDNNDALKQIPFNGKKTVPRALRKDLWAPLAVLQFPTFASEVGLSVYQRLREYKHLHEVLWDESIRYEEKEDKINTLTVRQRSRKLMDQKANSVADMAAVLGLLSTRTEIDEEVNEVETETGGKVGVLPIYKGNVGVVGEGSGVNVTIKWKDTLDAEFASEWTGNVIHDVMEQRLNLNDPTIPSPAERREEEMKERQERGANEKELKGKHQVYAKRGKGPVEEKKIETEEEIAERQAKKTERQAEYEQKKAERAAEKEKRRAEMEERQKAKQEKTSIAAAKHKELMASLKGTKQVYPSRGKGRKLLTAGDSEALGSTAESTGKTSPKDPTTSAEKPTTKTPSIITRTILINAKRARARMRNKLVNGKRKAAGKPPLPMPEWAKEDKPRRKGVLSREHIALMESLRGKQQNYKAKKTEDEIAEDEATRTKESELTPEERKSTRLEKHAELMESQSGTQQNYSPRKNRDKPSESEIDVAEAENKEPKPVKKRITRANAELLEQLRGTQQNYASRTEVTKKRAVTSVHMALMETLRGTRQNYPARQKKVVVTKSGKKFSEPERRGGSEHEALMARLKGTQQNYTPRGKGVVKDRK